MQVNWTDLQKAAGEAGFDPLPSSTYDVVVDTAEATKSSSGKDMVKATFKVEAGLYQGKKLFNQFVISPENANALAFFFRHMAAMGLNEAYFAAGPPLEQVARDLVNRRCRVKVSIREWQGTDRNQVDQVMPALAGTSDSPVTPAGPSPAPSPVGPVATGPGNTPVFAPPTPAVPGPVTPTTTVTPGSAPPKLPF